MQDVCAARIVARIVMHIMIDSLGGCRDLEPFWARWTEVGSKTNMEHHLSEERREE
jgi:hypothetical protein